MADERPDLLIPLVVGITGHRTVAEGSEGDLQDRVHALLSRLLALDARTPLVVLSPLAKGADRIAARAALRLRDETGGRVRVIAPLPLREDDYERDFAAAEDLAEYRELRGRCQGVFSLRPRRGAILDGAGLVDRESHERNLHYRRLGLHIALQSHVVIAMWNGDPPDPARIGGTADIIRFCSEGNHSLSPSDLEDLDIPFRSRRPLLASEPSTPVLTVATPRPGPNANRHLADAHRAAGRNDEILEREVRPLARPLVKMNHRLEPTPVPESVSIQAARAGRIDRLASGTKRRYLGWTLAVGLLALLGVASFQVVSSFEQGDGLVIAYLAFLAAALSLHTWGRWRTGTEETFLLARTTSEHLRVQVAWHHGGLDEFVGEHHIVRRGEDLRPIGTLCKGATVDLPLAPRQPSHPIEEWIAGQIRYFDPDEESMRSRARRARRHAAIQGVSFVTCVALAGWLLALWKAGSLQLDAALGETWKGWLTFAIGCFLALTVFLETLQKVRLDGEDLRTGHRMRALYQEAARRLRTTPFGPMYESDQRAILKAIGKEALDESADWFVRHRDRMERPGAG